MDQPVAPPWLSDLSAEFRSRYQFRKLLGAGVTSCVYLALQVSLDRNVVVKLLRTEYQPDSDVAERFRREAAVLADLHHDRVVTLLDFGTDGEVLFMVYPDVGGQSLECWCQGRTPVEPREVIPLLADILEGLSVIHAQDLVHRDLKPANLLVTDDGRVVLIDFGLAKNRAGHRTLTATGHIVGTPNYMAPGQVLGEPTSTGDDLYAVGVIAYEMLVGRNPFTAYDLTKTLQNHLTLRPDSPARIRPEVPQDLAEWVMDLLEKSESDRIPSADKARDRLVALEGVQSLHGVWIPRRGDDGPSRTQRMRRWIQARAREKKLGGFRLGMVFGALVAATLIGVLWPGGGPAGPSPGPSSAPGTASAPGPPDSAQREQGPALPSGLVQAIEDELVTLFERRVDAQGRVTDDPSARRSISADPAEWGEVSLRHRALGRFHDWLAAGGRPEALGEDVRGEMARVDGVFRDLGFLPPFAPYRRGRPSLEPVPPPPLTLLGKRPMGGDVDAEAWSGWAGRVRLALMAAEERRLDRERLLVRAIEAEEWERLPRDFERFLRLEGLVRPEAVEHHRQLSRMFAYYDTTELARREYVRWMDPDQALVRDLLWAAARTIRDQPEYADRVAYLMSFWAEQLRALLRGPVIHAEPRFALGFVPESPQGRHLEAAFWSWADIAADLPSRRSRQAATWTQALVPTGNSGWAQRRLGDAMGRGADAYSHAEDVEGWERHCRRSLALLPRLQEGAIRARAVGDLVWSAQVWSERIRVDLKPKLAASLGRIQDELASFDPATAPTLRLIRARLGG